MIKVYLDHFPPIIYVIGSMGTPKGGLSSRSEDLECFLRRLKAWKTKLAKRCWHEKKSFDMCEAIEVLASFCRVGLECHLNTISLARIGGQHVWTTSHSPRGTSQDAHFWWGLAGIPEQSGGARLGTSFGELQLLLPLPVTMSPAFHAGSIAQA